MISASVFLLLLGAMPFVDQPLATIGDTLPHPPREFTSGPLWVWNDLLTPEELEHSLDALAAAHIRQVWVHPRPGLMTPYLSDDWFALWKKTLELAHARDMLVWIYDENSYPSGFAGGLVPEAMPESRAQGLKVQIKENIDPRAENVLAIYRKTDAGYEDVTARLRKHPPKASESFTVVSTELAKFSPWYAGKYHVDLIRPGVTDKFLEITLGAYRARVGAEFGKTIPGIFTDEPHLKPCGDVHWTPDLPEQFERRWGQSVFAGLPCLKDATSEARTFRHHYFQLLNELFVERWAKPYYTACEKDGLELTGHYWEHDWPKCGAVPDNMSMAAWQQRPGIDILFNQYDEGPHAQFGNVRSVIELASIANQMGRRRTLCETYGGSGAEMTFEDYKRIGDWVEVLGVNTINEHLSDVTIRGARKRDYPPTFSYHSPWMAEYKSLADYFSRVSFLLSQGEQRNTCLVLEPTTTAWMHQLEAGDVLENLGNTFQSQVVQLARAQVEFDLGSEHVMQERGTVSSDSTGHAQLVVGARAYSVVVLPAGTENLNRVTVDLLQRYLELGGVVLSCAGAEQPACMDGAPSEACAALRRAATWTWVAPEDLIAQVRAHTVVSTRVVLEDAQNGVVYHHRRQLTDGEVLFVVNTSKTDVASGQVIAKVNGIREANLEDGSVELTVMLMQDDGSLAVKFSLPPCGSKMFLLDRNPVPAPGPAVASEARETLTLKHVAVKRLADNHLLLDYVDASAGGESVHDAFWQHAADLSFRKNGLQGNIWDHAVQFGDALLKTHFARDSGFEATYHFTIEGAVPKRLLAVIERADLYQIDCNGIPLTPVPGEWWLDRSFGEVDIAGAARIGENLLHVKASPMTVFHELEAAHLIGDFSLVARPKGFAVVPAASLGFGDWNQQGMPFYGDAVAYTAEIRMAKQGGRYLLRLPEWHGVVAGVYVNGKEAGPIYHQPYEREITAVLNPGKNHIEVRVYGSLRNTLGPHLGNTEIGLTHPGSWNKAPVTPQPPGADYFTIGYGLSAPFTVERIKE